jgi:Tol biopolymer transport system component
MSTLILRHDHRLYKLALCTALVLMAVALVPAQRIMAKNFSGAASPSWSPDGKHIAYVLLQQETSSLYMTDMAGSSPVLLADNAAEPSWSPDGKKIAFTNNAGDTQNIYILDIASKQTKKLTIGYSPKWSPDGKQLAFMVAGRFFVGAADGTPPRRMITEEALEIWDYAWSPDSQQIAFMAAGKNEDTADIYVMKPDGTGLHKIASGSYNVAFAWSPDSKQLAIVGICNDKNTDYICTINADGSQPHALFAYIGLQAIRPVWSPDGKQLLYTFGGQICLMQPDGTNRHCLTKLQGYSNDTDASWSPDGKHILFTRVDSPRTSSDEPDMHSTVYIMNADGSDVHMLPEVVKAS